MIRAPDEIEVMRRYEIFVGDDLAGVAQISNKPEEYQPADTRYVTIVDVYNSDVSRISWLVFLWFIADLRDTSEVVADENLVAAHDLNFVRCSYHFLSLDR